MDVEEATESGSSSYLGAALLFLEFYHFLAHTAVLCRIRMLPRKDLVRQRYVMSSSRRV